MILETVGVLVVSTGIFMAGYLTAKNKASREVNDSFDQVFAERAKRLSAERMCRMMTQKERDEVYADTEKEIEALVETFVDATVAEIHDISNRLSVRVVDKLSGE